MISAASTVTRLVLPHYLMTKTVPRPRIYIYDLPPQFSSWVDIKLLKHPLEAAFYERLYAS
eukprot:6113152-Pyramimonas_sp.AAC.1